jgi:hypothetical protein
VNLNVSFSLFHLRVFSFSVQLQNNFKYPRPSPQRLPFLPDFPFMFRHYCLSTTQQALDLVPYGALNFAAFSRGELIFEESTPG